MVKKESVYVSNELLNYRLGSGAGDGGGPRVLPEPSGANPFVPT